MEPKLTTITAKPAFPPEPQFHDVKKEKIEIPRIVPAELQAVPPVPLPDEEDNCPIAGDEEKPSATNTAPPVDMLQQLSRDLDELSKPLEAKPAVSAEQEKPPTSEEAPTKLEKTPAPTEKNKPGQEELPPVTVDPYDDPNDNLRQRMSVRPVGSLGAWRREAEIQRAKSHLSAIIPDEDVSIDYPQESSSLETSESPNDWKKEEANQEIEPTPFTAVPYEEEFPAYPPEEVSVEPLETPRAQETVGSSAHQPLPPITAVPYDEAFPVSSPASSTSSPASLDDLGVSDEPSSSHPIIKTIFLLICLSAIAVGAWQICLFLQPSFMQQDSISAFTQFSCKYLYCPPLKDLRFLNAEMNAAPTKGDWIITFKGMNPDMRPQPLPRIKITLEHEGKPNFVRTYEPSEYTVTPNEKTIRNGKVLNFEVLVPNPEGRPKKFTVEPEPVEPINP